MLAGNSFEVRFVCGGHSTPRAWKPTTSDISMLQQADLVILNGAGYESWVPLVSLPRSRTVDLSAVCTADLLSADSVVTHQHGPAGARSDSALVPCTWLRPVILRQQLREIQQRLTALRPQLADTIASRADAVATEIAELDRQVQLLRRSPDQQLSVLADSSCCAYLATDLGWELHEFSAEGRRLPQLESAALQAAINNIQPDFLLDQHSGATDQTADSGQADESAQAVMPSIRIDLCETEVPDASLIERLQSNLKAIAVATDGLNRNH